MVDTEKIEAQNCLNCGSDLHGEYCAHCGQKNTDLNLSTRKLMSEFVGEIFSLDSRIVRTLRPFIFKPGELTLQYSRGHRMKYVPPLKLYLFFSLLLFFILAVGNIKIAHVTEDGEFNIGWRNRPVNAAEPWVSKGIYFTLDLDQDESKSKNERKLSDLESELTKGAKKASKNPEIINNVVIIKMQNVLFFLFPLFALLLKILYFRSRYLFIHHLIFSIHFHSFSFLILFLSALLSLFQIYGANYLSAVILILIPVYLLMSMLRFYKGGWGITILKLVILYMTYIMVLFVTAMSVLLLYIVHY